MPERMTPEVSFEERDFPLKRPSPGALLEERVGGVYQHLHPPRQVSIRGALGGGDSAWVRCSDGEQDGKERQLPAPGEREQIHSLQIRRFPALSRCETASES